MNVSSVVSFLRIRLGISCSCVYKSLSQAAIKPPTFVFFVNDAKLFPETYRRYMEKQLRSSAGYAGTPIRLLWRPRRKAEKDDGECE